MNAIDFELTGFRPNDSDRENHAEEWKQHVTPLQGAFDFHFPGHPDEVFTGSSVVQRQGHRVLAQFTSTGMRYHRTARNAASDGDAGLRLVVPVAGRIGLTTGRDTVDLAPGRVGVFRMDHPMALEHATGMVGLIATVPEGVIPGRLTDGMPPDLGQRPMAALLSSHMAQLNALRDTMTSRQFTQGTEVMFQLLRYALEGEEAEAPRNVCSIAEAARRHVLAHSDDPDLSMRSLAAACHCSVSQLYKSLDGVRPAELLRTTRLEKAWDRLRDPRFRTIADIATASGFNHLTTFHQAFVHHFHITPGAARRQFLDGGPAVGATVGAAPS